jgi:hypothetical protein
VDSSGNVGGNLDSSADLHRNLSRTLHELKTLVEEGVNVIILQGLSQDRSFCSASFESAGIGSGVSLDAGLSLRINATQVSRLSSAFREHVD